MQAEVSAVQWSVDIGNIVVGVATVTIAFVTLYVSLKNIRALRVQKISEFRKEWIENLRSHFAEFISLCLSVPALEQVMNFHRKNKQSERQIEAEEEFKKALFRLSYVRHYIILMLNLDEDLHRQMDVLMRNMINDLTGTELTVPKEKWPDFSILARKILKSEWKRVREAQSKED